MEIPRQDGLYLKQGPQEYKTGVFDTCFWLPVEERCVATAELVNTHVELPHARAVPSELLRVLSGCTQRGTVR